jgi:hypothetical protein
MTISLPHPLLRVEHSQPSEAIRVTYRHVVSPNIDTEPNGILSEGGPSSILTPRTLTHELSLQGTKSSMPWHHSTTSDKPALSEGSDGQVIIGPLTRTDFVLPDR